ncbi:MAG: hypothetical protein HY356_08895 [Gammaproteobacteria bacterium]|nr:hypothetical protein [Gammaproteobacteria bacterium]
MNIQFNKTVITALAGLLTMLFFAPFSLAGEPWEPKGLEAVWSAGHRSHPEFMNVRRQEYESQIPAHTKVDPWMPKGLEAVWSGGHRTHPEFLNVRRHEYETQKSSENVPDSIVTIYEQGRSYQFKPDRLFSSNY